MFLTYLIVFAVYSMSILLVEKGYIFFLGASGIIFIFYIIIVGVLWLNGSKRSKNIEKELIEEKLR